MQRVVGDQAAADLGAALVADGDAIAARKIALDPGDAGRQQALAARRAPRAAPASTSTAPLSSSVPPIQIFRAATGSTASGTRCSGRPRRRARSGARRARRRSPCASPPAVAMRAASILVRMPPRDSSEAAPPAIASISGVTRSTIGMSFASGRSVRRRVVEAGDVGEQDQQVGARHGGDARGEPVVVAVADLAGGDRVVLVDDGNRAHRDQPAERLARVEIAAPLLGVLKRQQHLAGDDAVPMQRLRPGARQRDLADRGRGLAVLELELCPSAGRRRVRPSAIAPDETTITSAPRPCSAAMSATSASSHSCLSAPRARSTSSDEPTLTTMRWNFSRGGVWPRRGLRGNTREVRASAGVGPSRAAAALARQARRPTAAADGPGQSAFDVDPETRSSTPIGAPASTGASRGRVPKPSDATSRLPKDAAMREFRRPFRTRDARAGDRQRGRGRPHLRRLRRWPARGLSGERQGVQRDGGRGERAPPAADRPLRHEIRRPHPAHPPPGHPRLHPAQRRLADHAAAVDVVRAHAREMEQDAARFYRQALDPRHRRRRSASCSATSPRPRTSTTTRRRLETRAPDRRPPATRRTSTSAAGSSCRSSSPASSA